MLVVYYCTVEWMFLIISCFLAIGLRCVRSLSFQRFLVPYLDLRGLLLRKGRMRRKGKVGRVGEEREEKGGKGRKRQGCVMAAVVLTYRQFCKKKEQENISEAQRSRSSISIIKISFILRFIMSQLHQVT